MKDSGTVTVFEPQRISSNPLDSVRVGQWYWVRFMPDEKPEGAGDDFDRFTYNEKYAVEELFCVEGIGSNHIKFTRNTHHGSEGFRLHFDHFDRCRLEEHWEAHFQGRMKSMQVELRSILKKMLDEGSSLSLLPPERTPETPDGNLLPVVATESPEKYKRALVAFRDKRMPSLQARVKELSEGLAVTAGHLSLSAIVGLRRAKEALSVVEDRIFTVELYCGLQETVHQIADGTGSSRHPHLPAAAASLHGRGVPHRLRQRRYGLRPA